MPKSRGLKFHDGLCRRCRKNEKRVWSSGARGSYCVECNKAQARDYYRTRGRAVRYGISHEAALAFAEVVNCEICGEAETDERAHHLDHNHETGKVRGVLCFRCNLFVGMIERGAPVNETLAYLERTRGE